jgi:perosamine synthetase
MSLPAISFYPPLPPGAHLHRPLERLPYPLAEPGCELFSRGRHALWHAARALGIGAGDEVLVPSWHHGAEVEALLQAGAGVRFYEPGAALEPDPRELDGLLGPATRALFLTHFLGFPQDASRWRAWCDERGLLLVEDAAHACLARAGDRAAGAWGDAAVWCLFKSFGVPDGAALRMARDTPRPEGAPWSGAGAAGRRHATWLLQRSPALAHALAHPGRNGHAYDPAAEIALGAAGTQPSTVTLRLLGRVADAGAAAARRANYAVLLDELGPQVPEAFRRLPEGAVPLGLPLEARDKPALLARLAEHGIDGVDFWSVAHPGLPQLGFGLTRRRRATTVLLPVHQELRPAELERIAGAARTRPRRRAPLRVELVAEPGAIRAEWAALAKRARNVFATPEWTEAWCRHFLAGRRLELLAFRSPAGRLVGVLPLYVLVDGPVRVLRVAGHGPGEDLGPVCAPEDRPAVALALRGALDRLGAALLLAEQLPRACGWSALTGARVLRTEGSPVVHFGDQTWDAFLNGRSRRLRRELRRHERRLTRDHDVRYRLGGCDPGRLRVELDTLFALHAARFPDGSRFLEQADFHRDFAALACERGWLRLWFLDVDGLPVAASMEFRFAGVECGYQGGRDPAWSAWSPGMVLQTRIMRTAREDGIREYRLLRGGEAYKYRFADEDPGLETIVVGRGALGRTAAAAGTALPQAVTSAVRRWLAT